MRTQPLTPRLCNWFTLVFWAGFAVLATGVASSTLGQPQALDTLWTRSVVVTGPQYANDVITTSTGDVLIVGYTLTGPFLTMFDANGDVLWTRVYEEYSTGSQAHAVIQISDTSYVFSGPQSAGFSIFVACVNNSGQLLWSRTYHSQDYIHVGSLALTLESDIIVGIDNGMKQSILKLSASGDSLWSLSSSQQAFGRNGDIFELSNSEYLLTGTTAVPSGRGTFLAWRVSSEGVSIQEQSYGSGEEDWCSGAAQHSNGEISFVGWREDSSDLSTSTLVLRTSANADSLWMRDYRDYGCEGASSVLSNEGSGLFVLNTTTQSSAGLSDLQLLALDSVGHVQWVQSYGTQLAEISSGMTKMTDGSVVMIGWQFNPVSDWDVFVVRTLPPASSARETLLKSNELRLGPAFPNPFNSTLTLSLETFPRSNVTVTLYDLLGREIDVIHRGRLDSPTISYTAPASLSSGVYFVRASTGLQTQMQKVVLLK